MESWLICLESWLICLAEGNIGKGATDGPWQWGLQMLHSGQSTPDNLREQIAGKPMRVEAVKAVGNARNPAGLGSGSL